jgi:hypothetical protein
VAQYDKKKHAYEPMGEYNHEVVMTSDRWGNITSTSSVANTSAFGESISVGLSPTFQLDGLYGLPEDDFVLNSSLSGSQSVNENGLLQASSGTSAGAFATLRSKRSIRYRPGQGSMCRFTAMWPNGPTTGYQQVAGFINQSDVIAVGYNVNDNRFGIIIRYNSRGEIAKFSLTAPATGAETVTITLNDVAYNVPVTAGSLEHNASEIGNSSFPGWIVDYHDNEIKFLYEGPPAALPGAFSISSTGTLTGTYTQFQAGSSPTDTWIYQDEFSHDKLDGSGNSGMVIDTSKLNVFQIDFRWLGVGRMRFAVEDSTTGEMFPFHVQSFANSQTVTSVSNPSMRVGYASVNAAPQLGTGTDVIVSGASMLGAIQGPIVRNRTPSAIKTSNGTNLTANVKHHLLTIKNNRFDGLGKPNKLNQRELLLLGLSAGCTVSGSSGDAILVLLYKNVDLSVNREYIGITDSYCYSETLGTVTGQDEKLIGCFSISAGSDLNINLEEERIILAPLDYLSVVLESTASTDSQTVGLNFTVE